MPLGVSSVDRRVVGSGSGRAGEAASYREAGSGSGWLRSTVRWCLSGRSAGNRQIGCHSEHLTGTREIFERGRAEAFRAKRASTVSRTGRSSSITTTRPIGSPIASRLSPTPPEDRLKNRRASA